MTDQSRVLTGAVVGAALGSLLSYLFWTVEGRRVRDRIEPSLDDFGREMMRFRGTLERARTMAVEGWRVLNQLAGETPGSGSSWSPSRQIPH